MIRRYEQRARAATAEQTRRRVLDAMLGHLRRHPSEAVSVEAVARDAGVARSTVYVIFGSRAGLFDAVTADVMARTGFQRVIEAAAEPDPRQHLRVALRASTEVFAAERDVARALYSMAQLDPDAVGGAIQRLEEGRRGGMERLAARLDQAGLLHAGVSVGEAVDLLWTITSFDAFDLLHTGRGLPVAEVSDRLLALAERAVLRPDRPAPARRRRGPAGDRPPDRA
jgi:AcrR family transcriptional regulator